MYVLFSIVCFWKVVKFQNNLKYFMLLICSSEDFILIIKCFNYFWMEMKKNKKKIHLKKFCTSEVVGCRHFIDVLNFEKDFRK